MKNGEKQIKDLTGPKLIKGEGVGYDLEPGFELESPIETILALMGAGQMISALNNSLETGQFTAAEGEDFAATYNEQGFAGVQGWLVKNHPELLKEEQVKEYYSEQPETLQ